MSRWTPPQWNEDTPALVREAWRVRVFDEVAADHAARKQKAEMRHAVLAGLVIGIAGSAAIFLLA